jgi:hypothetical protein
MTTTTPAGPFATLLESFLNFVKHPGTSTGLGLSLAALSQFTAAVPKSDRTTPTLIGLGYALAVQVMHKMMPDVPGSTVVPPVPPVTK